MIEQLITIAGTAGAVLAVVVPMELRIGACLDRIESCLDRTIARTDRIKPDSSVGTAD